MKGFFDKVVARLDRMDAESVRRQYKALTRNLEFFESVFQALREGVMVAGQDRVLLYANAAAGRLAHFEPEKAVGRSLVHFLPDWDWDGILGLSQGDSAPGWASSAVREIEIAYPEHRILEVQAMPSASGTVAIIRDVTDAHAREADALESGRNDAIQELASSVAHEIGNPLNALSLNLDMLAREFREEPDPERRARLLDDINVARDEVKRIDGINRRFLAALRPVRPNFAPGSISEPLSDTLNEMAKQFKDRNISVAIDLPQAMPLVMLDRAQMRQVFFNLLKNALEAMKDGGFLSVELSSDDRSVYVSLRDSGAGISSDELAHIFDPFRTTKATGNGLGLMICRRIVRAHGGEIDVSSKEGEGARFTVVLPRLEKRVRRLT